MGTAAPTTVFIPVRYAPKKAPCPRCGKLGRRKRTLCPRGAHGRLQGDRLLEGHLRRVHGSMRLLHDVPHHSRGRAPQGPLRQQGPRSGARSHRQGRNEHRAAVGVVAARVLAGAVLGIRLQGAPRSGRRTRHVGASSPGSGTVSAARSAWTNCTWAATRCCWRRIR